ncbi:LLM class flavin-dependent oxidoreductase [Bdellovibrio sp. HCB209]|uniref:LLM class flavin-dependent oxidoreductase n=1 Tax=Bdellovibrio sp. HCB209 TaxID=3394354 RepID=UPI0039B60967
MKINLSVLDLVMINKDSNAQTALHDALKVAQKVEELGYTRFWVAEHHNSISTGSAATPVAVGFLAAGTKKIRVGAGGVMLPNHAPLIIAEQFGTLESLYPGRIDLGLGRATGTELNTLHALRRSPDSSESFPQDVQELQGYFENHSEGKTITATPGQGLSIPLWILGSSTFGAQLAAHLGLPFAFAGHIAPASMRDAIEIYRSNFKPSKQLKSPYVAISINLVAAETDKEAEFHFSSHQQYLINYARGLKEKFPSPIADMTSFWSAREKMFLDRMLGFSVIGSPEKIRIDLGSAYQETKADEFIVVSSIFDTEARLRSYEILSNVVSSI